MAIDPTPFLAPILAAWTLVTVAGHPLPSASSAAVTVMGVAAASGVFASLAVHARAQGLPSPRACGVQVERAPSSLRSVANAAALAPLVNAFARWHQGALDT
jgi:hypothetical protein